MTPTPFIQKLIENLAPSRAIDIGCGNGRNALYLKERGWNVLAVDIVEQGVEDVSFVKSSLENLQVDSQYELVLCLMVLHFLSSHDAVESNLLKLQELTELNGYLCVSVITNENDSHVRSYLFAPNELESHFSDWKIVLKEHELAAPVIDNGKEVRYWVARYILQKNK